MDHFLADVEAAAGNKAEARRIAAKLEEESKHGYVCPYEVAEIYGQLGEKDAAFPGCSAAFRNNAIASCISSPNPGSTTLSAPTPAMRRSSSA